MSQANPDLLVFALLRVVVLLVGLAFAYMGYRLFMSGLQNPSGDIELEGGRFKLKVMKAAPGIFFALIGGAIVVYQVTRVLQYSNPGALGQPSEQPAPGIQTCDTCSINGGMPADPQHVVNEDPAPSPGVTICDTCSAPAQVPNNPGVTICDTCAQSPVTTPGVLICDTCRVSPLLVPAGHTVICDTCSQRSRRLVPRRPDQ